MFILKSFLLIVLILCCNANIIMADANIKAGVENNGHLHSNHRIVDDNIAIGSWNSIKFIDINSGNQNKEIFYHGLIQYFENNSIFTVVDGYYDKGLVLSRIDNNINQLISKDTIKVDNKLFYLHINKNIIIDYDKEDDLIFMYGYIMFNNNKEYYLVVWDALKSEIIDTFIYDKYDKNIHCIKVIDKSNFIIANSEQILHFQYKDNELSVIKALDFTNVERINFIKGTNILSLLKDFYNSKILYFYDIDKNEIVNQIETSSNYYDVNIKNNSTIISYVDTENKIVIYDIATQSIINSFEVDFRASLAIFYKEDFIIVFSKVDGRMELYNIKSGDFVRSLLYNASSYDVMQMSEDDENIVYGGFTSVEFCDLTISNLQSARVINRIRLQLDYHPDRPINIDIKDNYVFLSYGKHLITWDYYSDSLYKNYLGNDISDLCINSSNNNILAVTLEGEIFIFSNLLEELYSYSLSDEYEIISGNFNDKGNKVYCLLNNINSNENSLFELNIESGYINISNDYLLPVTTDISGKRQHHREYFYDKYSMFDVNKKESKNIYADYDPVMQNIRLSKNGNYALYADFQYYQDDFELFYLNGVHDWSKPNYTYNSNTFYKEIHYYHDSPNIEASNAIFSKNNEIIVGLRNGSLVILNLQDTLNTSYREVSQNGEALISEFYNYDDVLTIEVNPDINRQIKYQITDISGNTIQNGTLPEGIQNNQINFFGHPKSSYFIMFHTETSRQIFKFIN